MKLFNLRAFTSIKSCNTALALEFDVYKGEDGCSLACKIIAAITRGYHSRLLLRRS